MIYNDHKWLINKRATINRNLDRTEEMIMELIRHNIDPTDYIYYRELLKSRAHDVQQELNNK